jgi:hypothetical protein
MAPERPAGARRAVLAVVAVVTLAGLLALQACPSSDAPSTPPTPIGPATAEQQPTAPLRVRSERVQAPAQSSDAQPTSGSTGASVEVVAEEDVREETVALVRVVEEDGETPVAGASVVSLTEATTRELDVLELIGRPGPGSAVTDVDGRCEVGGLSAGEHVFDVRAPGHEQVAATWSEGPLLVRLARVAGVGTVEVTVFGPDGKPASGIEVELRGDGRKATTGPDGRALFDEVPAGARFVNFTMPFERSDIDAWAERMRDGMRVLAPVAVDPGGRHRVALGWVPGTASFEARLVGADGAPVVGVEVTLFVDLAIHKATSDADGFIRLADLTPGKLTWTFVDLGTVNWTIPDVEVDEHQRETRTWTFGAATLRGRVVQGPERKPVEGAKVAAQGPMLGVGDTDASGRFEFPRASAGKYRISARTKDRRLATRTDESVAPSDSEVVLELIETGRLVVRFAASDRSLLRDATFKARAKDGAAPKLRRQKSGEDDLVAEHVLPGAYEVVVELAGRTRAFPVEVKGGATAIVEVRAP